MSALNIITDSACDLPKKILDKYKIKVVPITVEIDGEIYHENIDITPKEFYKKMAASKNLPKTSQPTPAAFANIFREQSKSGRVLCITLSSGLSGTYQSACLGKELSGADVTVFDSLAGSLGQGLLVLKAARLSQAGHSLEQIIKELEKYRSNINILIMLNTLDNIVKGGRLGKIQGHLGKILDIRILLSSNKEGKVILLSRIRGLKKFMAELSKQIIQRMPDMSGMDIGITHFNNLENAEIIKKMVIEKLHAKNVIINDMGTVMATYAGEGGIIVSF